MKSGFMTSEFLSQLLGPYGIALAILYVGLGDTETLELLKQAISGFSPQAQAVVLLGIKFASILGAAIVGAKGADTTKAYNNGRAQLKLKEMDKKECV
jgi:hypothetical protein